MKTLKVKSIFFSLMALMAVAVFMTSCEQENVLSSDVVEGIELDGTNLVVTEPINIIEETDNEITSRHCPESFRNGVATRLNTLINAIQKINNGTGTIAQVDAAFDAYTDFLDCKLPPFVNVPEFNYTPGSYVPCIFNPASYSCNSVAVDALLLFQCSLNNYLNNPNSTANQQLLANHFEFYINVLNSCFGIGFNAPAYGNSVDFT